MTGVDMEPHEVSERRELLLHTARESFLDRKKAERWLQVPKPCLDGRTPLEALEDEHRFEELMEYLVSNTYQRAMD